MEWRFGGAVYAPIGVLSLRRRDSWHRFLGCKAQRQRHDLSAFVLWMNECKRACMWLLLTEPLSHSLHVRHELLSAVGNTRALAVLELARAEIVDALGEARLRDLIERLLHLRQLQLVHRLHQSVALRGSRRTQEAIHGSGRMKQPRPRVRLCTALYY